MQLTIKRMKNINQGYLRNICIFLLNKVSNWFGPIKEANFEELNKKYMVESMDFAIYFDQCLSRKKGFPSMSW